MHKFKPFKNHQILSHQTKWYGTTSFRDATYFVTSFRWKFRSQPQAAQLSTGSLFGLHLNSLHPSLEYEPCKLWFLWHSVNTTFVTYSTTFLWKFLWQPQIEQFIATFAIAWNSWQPSTFPPKWAWIFRHSSCDTFPSPMSFVFLWSPFFLLNLKRWKIKTLIIATQVLRTYIIRDWLLEY